MASERRSQGQGAGALRAIDEPVRGRKSWVSGLLRVARKKPLGTVGAIAIFLFILVAIFANVLSPHDPTNTVPGWRLLPPTLEHPMGGDYLGRDLLSNIIHGARLSLAIGILSVLCGTLTGSSLGILSAYMGGKVDFAIQRVIDTIMAFPTLILAIAIVAFLGPHLINVVFAISITLIPTTSRVLRGAVLSIKENQYIEAAKSIGAGSFRIMGRHVLPNAMAPIIILASIELGAAIIAEASLSFLGLGVPPPASSWGRMLGGESIRFMTIAPWILIFPGMAISIVVLAFNLLGDTVRDVLDPRLRGTR